MTPATLHRGSVLVAAVLVDEALLGTEAARARVIALWCPGATVRRVDGGWLVAWPEPRRLRSDEVPGLALTLTPGGALVDGPACAGAAGSAAPGALVRTRGGRATVEPPGAPVDPAAWLDLDELALASVAPLAAPPAPPPCAPAPPPAREARALLGGRIGAAPAGSDEAREALDALRTGRPPPRGRRSRLAGLERVLDGAARAAGRVKWRGVGLFVLVSAGVLLLLLAGATGSFPALYALVALAGALSRYRRAPRPAARPPAAAGAPPSPPGWRRRLGSWLAARLGRTPFGGWLGQRQARYLRRMMELFERGELDEALRHGIPIGGDEDGGAALTPPTPRTQIAIQPWARAGQGGAIGVGAYLDSIRAAYRKAFVRLERERRFEEAAFVLAELLRCHGEAVAFLEKHGQLRLAAELAEARGRPPGEVVRLWLLAGDAARALRLAHRHGCFADAIARLSAQHPEAATGLRLAWADACATRGDFMGAVDALGAQAARQPLARAWLERALALGGASEARALVRRLELYPGDFAAVRTRWRVLCADPDAAPARRQLTSALVASHGKARAELGALARPLVRAVLRDGVTSRDVAVLSSLAGAELAQDLPGEKHFAAAPPPPLSLPAWHSISSDDAGLVGACDAVRLPSGRFLVALGEAGVLVVDAHGRVQHHFDEPCDRLVPAAAGHATLALAARGDDVWRIARLDLLGAGATSWGIVRATHFASEHDGAQWVIGDGDAVRALDVLAPSPRTLWERDRLGAVQGIAIDVLQSQLGVLSAEGAWGYQLAAGAEPVLRSRTQRLPLVDGEAPPVVESVTPDGAVVELGARRGPTSTEAQPTLSTRLERHRSVLLVATMAEGARLTGAPACVVKIEPGAGHARVTAYTRPVLAARLTVDLGGADAAGVSARLQSDELVVADGRGRVVVLSLATGRRLVDVRLRWP